MAGFATVDSLISALSQSSKGQRLLYNKTMASVSVANVPHTLWTATGLPAAGTYGSVGKANGRTLTDVTTGGWPFTNASVSETMHLVRAGAAPITASATGSLVLVDRISDVLLAHAEATGSITGLSATSRLASGEGAMIWCEVQSALSAGSNTWALSYTNQAGTNSRSTSIVTTASAIVGRSPNAALFQPLQAGDTGVRSIESLTLTGTATGQIALCLVKPLLFLPLPAVSTYVERDCVVELPSLPRIYDDACLHWIYVPTAAVTATFFGEVLIASN